MNTVVLPPEVQAQFDALKDLTEVRTAKGELLGYFAPRSIPDAERYANAAAHFDPEKIHELGKQQSSGVTTQELMNKLRTIFDKGKQYKTREVFEGLKSLTSDAEMQSYLQSKIEILKEREACASP